MKPAFWKKKRVLLTGHTGFKGSWLALWLQTLGAEVLGYSLPPPTQPSLYELARVADGMKSLTADIREAVRVRAEISEFRPEIVVHMAAQSLVRRSYQDPVGTYDTNVLGTAHVLEAIRHVHSVRAALIVTSDKCYQNHRADHAFIETDPLGGDDPYSSSKACAELVTAAYRQSFFSAADAPGIASARAGNVIGGGDWSEDRLVPDVMRAFLDHKVVMLRNPGAVRPWQHVLEPLAGYLLLIEKLWAKPAAYAQAWNFGPQESDARPVSWLVDRMAALWRDGATWKHDNGRHPPESKYLRLDSSKAHKQLGWKPQLGLERALDATVAWYRAYGRSEDVRALVLEQIGSYQNAPAAAAGGR